MGSKAEPIFQKKKRRGANMEVFIDLGVRVVYAMLILVVVFGAVLIVSKTVRYLSQYVVTPGEISSVEIYWDGAVDDGLSASFRQALGEWTTKPTGLADDGSQVVSFAYASANRAQSTLENVDISIGGVQIKSAFSAFKSVFEPPSFRMVGEGAGTSLTVRLMLGNKQIQSWQFEGEPPIASAGPDKTPNSGDIAANRAELLEGAVFRILFDLWRGVGTSKFEKGDDMKQFKSEKALEAYLRGTNYLLYYLRSREHDHLSRAIDELRILRWEEPTFREGLDLLALALAEDRRETEAIEIYDYLLGGAGPVECQKLSNKAESFDARTALAQQEINRAAAHFRAYSQASGATAIRNLEALLSCLEKVVEGTAGGQEAERAQWKSLQGYAHAHLADVYGHFLNYLFSRSKTPAENEYLKQLMPDLDEKTDWDQVREYFWTEHLSNLEEAKKLRDSAIAYWSSDKDDARQQSEKAGLDRLILSAEGYTLYLNARWRKASFDGNGVADRQPFIDSCHQAISLLRQADAAQPNHYTVLQNLATVYSNRVFDPEGEHWRTAERLYKRSLTLTSNDYYGAQRIALLIGENLQTVAVQDDDLFQKAIDRVEESLKYNSRSSTSYLLRARLEMWKSKDAQSDGETDQNKVERDIGRAKDLRAPPQALEWARIVRLVHKIPNLPASKPKPSEGAPEKWDEKVEAETDYDIAIRELTQLLEKALDDMGRPTHDGDIAEHEKFSSLLEEVNALKFEDRALLRPRF